MKIQIEFIIRDNGDLVEFLDVKPCDYFYLTSHLDEKAIEELDNMQMAFPKFDYTYQYVLEKYNLISEKNIEYTLLTITESFNYNLTEKTTFLSPDNILRCTTYSDGKEKIIQDIRVTTNCSVRTIMERASSLFEWDKAYYHIFLDPGTPKQKSYHKGDYIKTIITD